MALIAILLVAASLRLIFYTGFFGSDEVTYIEYSKRLVEGDWTASDYIGAIRYGMNLPIAIAFAFFGVSEAAANLWPFLCSVAEVGLVFFIANTFFGLRTALMSSGVLALLPIHVHYAGRMMADAPLAFFMTLSFALLVRAVSAGGVAGYFAAGLAFSGVFWVKESVAMLYFPVFIALMFFMNSGRGKWPWLLVGAGAGFAANCAFMAVVAGNPFHVFASIDASMVRFHQNAPENGAGYYLWYLFIDVRHTFALGVLALGGGYLLARSPAVLGKPNSRVILIWAIALVGMFSLAVVSFSPVKLVSKQTNYMLIFAAPLGVLAGYFLASIRANVLVICGSLTALGSITLAALEQQAVRVFTANSRATYGFLATNSEEILFGSRNNERYVYYESVLAGRSDVYRRVAEIKLLDSDFPTLLKKVPDLVGKTRVFAMIDPENINWGNATGSVRRAQHVPSCWNPAGELRPAPLGSGAVVVDWLLAAGNLLPQRLAERFKEILRPVAVPQPARLYSVDLACLARR